MNQGQWYLSRRLHGRRGLKLRRSRINPCPNGRRLHGRRGLKLFTSEPRQVGQGRRLHGRRGLKFTLCCNNKVLYIVAAFTGGVD